MGSISALLGPTHGALGGALNMGNRITNVMVTKTQSVAKEFFRLFANFSKTIPTLAPYLALGLISISGIGITTYLIIHKIGLIHFNNDDSDAKSTIFLNAIQKTSSGSNQEMVLSKTVMPIEMFERCVPKLEAFPPAEMPVPLKATLERPFKYFIALTSPVQEDSEIEKVTGVIVPQQIFNKCEELWAQNLSDDESDLSDEEIANSQTLQIDTECDPSNPFCPCDYCILHEWDDDEESISDSTEIVDNLLTVESPKKDYLSAESLEAAGVSKNGEGSSIDQTTFKSSVQQQTSTGARISERDEMKQYDSGLGSVSSGVEIKTSFTAQSDDNDVDENMPDYAEVMTNHPPVDFPKDSQLIAGTLEVVEVSKTGEVSSVDEATSRFSIQQSSTGIRILELDKVEQSDSTVASVGGRIKRKSGSMVQHRIKMIEQGKRKEQGKTKKKISRVIKRIQPFFRKH